MSPAHGGPVLLTCEHGGARIPPELRHLFRSPAACRALASHRGHDVGALEMARGLRKLLGAPLLAATVSRLVVDLNRRPSNPALLSEFTRRLDPAAREALLDRLWRPHRHEVERVLAALVGGGGRVLHVAVHAFAPEVRGVPRHADVALLYDPGRAAERALAEAWVARLRALAPDLRVRRNYPFRGVSDGLTTHLRTLHPDRRYAGIELEVNTRFAAEGGASWRRVRRVVGESLVGLLEG